MERFVPREKMSKKARRELDRQRRAVWTMSPVTRVSKSNRRPGRALALRLCRMEEDEL